MSTFTNLSKNSVTVSNVQKTASEIIYLVSESLDNYLVGASSNETLVTQDQMTWNNLIKN